jgi:uroporphyrinogen III methyltransferase/synthase
VEQAGLGAPAVIVVGECAGLRTELRWFERMPLFGRRIVVTRAAGNAARFANRLRALGAEAIEFPTIENAPPASFAILDRAIAELASFDWIVFTSATGVTAFIERMRTIGHDIRELGRASIAAIGPITARRLETFALRVAATPSEYRAEAIIGAIGESRIKGARILIPRAVVAREILPELMTRHGAREVVVAPAYRTVIPAHPDATFIRELIAARAIDLVTFTSASTVTNFCAIAGEMPPALKAAVIGPITAATARARGFDVVIQPAAYTVDSLTSSITEYFGARR